MWQMFRSRWQYWIAWPKIPLFSYFLFSYSYFSKFPIVFFFVLFGFFQLFRFFDCFQAYVPCGRWRATGNRLYMPFSIFFSPNHTFTHFFRIYRHQRFHCLRIHPTPPQPSFSPPFFFNPQILGSLLAFLFFHSLFHLASSITFHVF